MSTDTKGATQRRVNKRNLLGSIVNEGATHRGVNKRKPAWFYCEQRGVLGITINKNRVPGLTTIDTDDRATHTRYTTVASYACLIVADNKG